MTCGYAKRVLVSASYILIVSAVQLPALAQGLPLSWFVAATMPLVTAINLIVLARTPKLLTLVFTPTHEQHAPTHGGPRSGFGSRLRRT